MTYYLQFGFGESLFVFKSNVDIDNFCNLFLDFMKEEPCSGSTFITKKHQLEELKEYIDFSEHTDMIYNGPNKEEECSDYFEYCLTKNDVYEKVKIYNNEIMLGDFITIHQNDEFYNYKTECVQKSLMDH